MNIHTVYLEKYLHSQTDIIRVYSNIHFVTIQLLFTIPMHYSKIISIKHYAICTNNQNKYLDIWLVVTAEDANTKSLSL